MEYQQLIRDIYTQEHVGICVLQNILSTTTCSDIDAFLSERTSLHVPYNDKQSALRYDIDLQSECCILNEVQDALLQVIDLANMYTHLNPVYAQKVTSLYYLAGSEGVGPHRDSVHSVNFVAIFIISGNSNFYAAHDKECLQETVLSPRIGDVVLMRAPRSLDDALSRPIHYIKHVDVERRVLVCRHINLSGLQAHTLT